MRLAEGFLRRGCDCLYGRRIRRGGSVLGGSVLGGSVLGGCVLDFCSLGGKFSFGGV